MTFIYLLFKKNLRFDNKKERYETRLAFKDYSEILPDNYNLAKHRLSSLKNRLSKNIDLFNEYDKIMNDYLKEDIVEIVPPSEEIVLPGSTHYLPHRAVVKENRETTKVRIVFDDSAHSPNEPSINDVLYSGPCLLSLIFDILIRFRTRKIGIVADVKQTFHQIEIVKEHRDFLRFLWFKDILYNQETITLRFKRIIFGLTCSPFLLNGTIKEHLQKYLPLLDYREVVLQMLENLYVDDSSNSFNGIKQCLNFYEHSKKCLADANLHLRKWATNDSLVQKVIDDKENKSEETPSSNPQHNDETYVQN